MRIEYTTNFSGFFVLFRAILFLLKDKKLNLTQFGAYMVFISQVSYDKRHKHYKAIIRSDQEIARELGLSYDTIHKHRKDLIEIGLLVEKDGITFAPSFYLFEWEWAIILVKLLPDYLRQLFVNLQTDIDHIPQELVKMQKDRAQKVPKDSNFSSNDDLPSSMQNNEEELKEYFDVTEIENDEIK